MNKDAGQVTQDDITIESNHETVDQIQLAFADSTPPDDKTSVEAPTPQSPDQSAVPGEDRGAYPANDCATSCRSSSTESSS